MRRIGLASAALTRSEAAGHLSIGQVLGPVPLVGLPAADKYAGLLIIMY